MTRVQRIAMAMSVVGIILSLVALLSGCGSSHHDDHHSHMPVVHTTPVGCHWSDVTHKQKKHVKVHGRWKYVTIKTHTKSLICDH